MHWYSFIISILILFPLYMLPAITPTHWHIKNMLVAVKNMLIRFEIMVNIMQMDIISSVTIQSVSSCPHFDTRMRYVSPVLQECKCKLMNKTNSFVSLHLQYQRRFRFPNQHNILTPFYGRTWIDSWYLIVILVPFRVSMFPAITPTYWQAEWCLGW